MANNNEKKKPIEISEEDCKHVLKFLVELNPHIGREIEPKDYDFSMILKPFIANTTEYLIKRGIVGGKWNPDAKDGFKQRLTDYDIILISLYYDNMKMETENASSENDYHKMHAIINLIVRRDIQLLSVTSRHDISEIIWRPIVGLTNTNIPVLDHYRRIVNGMLDELFPVAYEKKMTLLEQLQTVRRDESNDATERGIYPGDIGESLDINNCHVYDKPIEGLKAYWIFSYSIDDYSGYGDAALYFNDELVGLRTQNSKKGDKQFSWVSKDAYHKMRKVTLTYLEHLEQEESEYILTANQLSAVQENYTTLSFASAVESKYCEMDKKPYKITNTRLGKEDNTSGLRYNIEIEDLEGNKQIVHCGNVYYPMMCEPVLEAFKGFEINKEENNG